MFKSCDHTISRSNGPSVNHPSPGLKAVARLAELFSRTRGRVSGNRLHACTWVLMLAGAYFLSFKGRTYAQQVEVASSYLYLHTMVSGTPATMQAQVLDTELDEITGSIAIFRDTRSTGYLQLGIDPAELNCYDGYRRLKVIFDVTYTTLNSWDCTSTGSVDTTHHTGTDTLIIDYDPLNQAVYTEKTRKLYENAYYVKAVVNTVELYDLSNTLVFSGTSYSSLPTDLYFQVGLSIERHEDFDYNTSPSNFELSLGVLSDEIVFNWDFMQGAEYYELEFGYVNDYSATDVSTHVAAGSIQTTFLNNATLVRLNNTQNSYTIPDIFDRGYVFARIRGVGRYSTDLSDYCDLSHEIAGEWSYENTYSGGFTLISMNSDHYIAVDRHEGSGSGKNKNWKMSGSYAEEGKHKEIVEYADGSSRVRQSITKLSSTGEVIIGETAYDYQGRPTVQILPVPVVSSLMAYYPNFNLEEGGDKFNREHFDDDGVFTTGCIPTPPLLKTTSGASYYYSASNSYQSDFQAFVPDAEQYPYTQVVYTPDNTGRIKMQSGVGSGHILGSGHETRYFYGKPSQEEMDRLFGTNVGNKSHYQKNMVVDANGQVSISFLDMAGKTIATSLAGEPTANTEALLNSNNDPLYQAEAETLTVNLLGNVTAQFANGEDNHLSADGLVWSNQVPLLVESEQTYRFTYSAEWVDYLDSCLEDVCFDCEYELELNILDACNQPLSGFPLSISLGGEPDTLCNIPNEFSLDDTLSNDYIDVLLGVGNYTVEKKLRLNESVIGFYTQEYIEHNECLLTWDDFYEEPDTSGCFYDCEDCLAALGDSTAFYAEYDSSGIPIEDLRATWLSRKAGCDKMCNESNTNMCRVGYDMMLNDLKPGGQYATYDRDEVTSEIIPASDKLSIFNEDPYLPDFTNTGGTYEPTGWLWRQPHYFNYDDPATYTTFDDPANEYYFDDNGLPSKIYLDQDYVGNWVPAVVAGATIDQDANGYFTYPQFLQKMEDFISMFKSSWSRSLLVYHPEFLQLQACIEISSYTSTISSEDYDTWTYDKLLQDQDSYSGPSSVSAIITNTSDFDLREQDPFFTHYGSTSLMGVITIDGAYNLLSSSYLILAPQTLDIWEYSHVVEHCNVSDPSFAESDIAGCAPTAMDGPDKSLYIQNQAEWDRLVGAHLDLKQRIISYLIDDLVDNSSAVSNRCIGYVNYDAGNMPHTVHPWLPCDLVEYYRYANKDPRFPAPSSINNSGNFDPAPPTPEQLQAYGQQQVYELTHICPAGMDLKTLVNGLLVHGNLVTGSYGLTGDASLMPVLRGKIEDANGGSVPSYSGSVTGQVLTATIGASYFELTLPSGYSWSDVQAIQEISDVFLSLGEFTFSFNAQVFNTATTTVDNVEITGVTDLRIGDCESEIPKLCKATQEAKDLKALLAKLNHDGMLGSNFTLSSYYSYITMWIQAYIGSGGSGDFDWDNPSSGLYTLTNTSTGEYLEIHIDPGDISDFTNSAYFFDNIAGDIGVSATVANTSLFVINGFTTSVSQFFHNAYDFTVEGSVVTSPGVGRDFVIAECNEVTPINCETYEHRNYFELKRYISSNPIVPNPCISNLEVNGSAPMGPLGTFQLLSLLPDLDFSTDGISSTHFTAEILVTGETTPDVITGIYCKPIRPCSECDTLVVDSCDALYYTIDMTGATPSGYDDTYAFTIPADLMECYDHYVPFLTASEKGTLGLNSYTTLEDFLEAWANYLNDNGDGRVQAYHPSGTEIIVISFHGLLGNGCECYGDSTNQEGHLNAYGGGSIWYNEDIAKQCCNEYTPPPASLLGGGSPMLLLEEEEESWEEPVPITLTGPCDMNLAPFPSIPPVTTNPCVTSLIAAATLNANNAYEAYLDSVRQAFRANYIAQCMTVTESFRANFINTQYHFTLYYYDQAGNLVKTVPPKAVQTIDVADLDDVADAREAGTTYYAGHDVTSTNEELLSTKYVYNTLNQPRYQRTPDGGQTEFVYDALGRLALSRNAKQAAMSDYVYSYTIYDGLGRISEVGQLSATVQMTQDNALAAITNVPIYIALTNIDHTEITSTIYDTEYTGNPGIVQKELRNRVSYTTYRDAYADPSKSATYYSYDIHGNVSTLWQENTEIPDASQQVKKMEYDYDLVSGKVNKVWYQRNQADQWIHTYSYDADNRITEVYTSRDNVFYDRDASYHYYKHGPLARTEYGQNNVQGIDYAYTIHGWIKAVNATNLASDLDMGQDGEPATTNSTFAKDAFSYALEYYNGDYSNISGNTSFKSDISTYFTYYPDAGLFNGNIRLMQTTVKNNSGVPIPILSVYNYDQLNRLIRVDYNADFNLASNTFGYSADTRYKDYFSYDANGNILTQERNGEIGNLSMDDLTYHYTAGTNRLEYVDDAVSSTYTDDIDDQSSGNYTYDEIGNLIGDTQEEILNIEWSVYGKVLEVDRFVGTRPFLYFSYGPGGQRITKKVSPQGEGSVSYYYFHDATGNVMGIYKFEEDVLYLEEQMMYGSSRIGSVVIHEKIDSTTVPDSVKFDVKRGQKRYELSNHLGNVLTTVSDRKKWDCEHSVYDADLINVSDYSAFGAPLSDRTWSVNESYRFGFNGQEKDNEVYGEGNSYTAEHWEYDPRIGRRWNVDPMSSKYPFQSCYSALNNNPIYSYDPSGAEAEVGPGKGAGDKLRSAGFKKEKMHKTTTGVGVLPNNASSTPSNTVASGAITIGSGISTPENTTTNNNTDISTVTVPVTDLKELIIAQKVGVRNVELSGEVLNNIREDISVYNLEANYLRKILTDTKYGNEPFEIDGFEDDFMLGGWTSPEPMKYQFTMTVLDPGNSFSRYRDTWKVAGRRTTWVARHVDLFTKISVTGSGVITMNFEFNDVLDLRANGQDPTYDKTVNILGGIYHEGLGIPDQMKTHAAWSRTFGAWTR